MLNLAVKKGVKAYIEMLPMKEAGKALRSVKENDVRYRHVLKYVNNLSLYTNGF